MFAVVADYLSKTSLDAIVLTTTDAHASEFIGESDKILHAVTGFTGSYGMALVQKDKGFLFTDARYHIQAPKELHPEFTLVKTLDEFIKILGNCTSIGLDTRNMTQSTFSKYKDKLKNVNFIPDLDFVDSIWKNRPKRIFREIEDIENLLLGPYIDDDIRSVVVVPEKFERVNVTGSFRREKLSDVIENIKDDTAVLTALDEIAWLLNLRGTDIPYNPVFYSFFIVSKNNIILYTNAKVEADGFHSEEESTMLNGDENSQASKNGESQFYRSQRDKGSIHGETTKSENTHHGDLENEIYVPKIRVKSYEKFYEDLKSISGTVHVSPSASVYVRSVLSNCQVKNFEYIRERKSVKNEVEILGERMAHLYDAIALVKLFDALQLEISDSSYSQAKISHGNEIDPEKAVKIVKKEDNIQILREEVRNLRFSCAEEQKTDQYHSKCETEPQIVPNPSTISTKSAKPPLLTEIQVDFMLNTLKKEFAAYRGPSFATIAGSNQNGAIIHHAASQNELVKDALLLTDTGSQYYFGTTDISRTISLGTPTENQKRDFTTVLKAQIAGMTQIIKKDTPASALDTITRSLLWQTKNDYSHATGHGVAHFGNVHEDPPSISSCGKPIKPGQIFSIEPGIYRENEYGIRIEDLVLAHQEGDWISFENITLTPLQLKMIDRNLLTEKEISYINEFNKKVRSILKNFIKEGDLGYGFLIENTESL